MSALLVLMPFSLFGQPKRISGVVIDKKNQEALVGATVACAGKPVGVVTDTEGHFVLRLNPGQCDSLVVRSVGFQHLVVSINSIRQDQVVTFELDEEIVLGKEVEVVADGFGAVGLGVRNVNRVQLDNLPAFLGQKDVLKTLQVQSGAQMGIEGKTTLLVRGGNPDQNLFVVDGVPLNNYAHAGGFVSFINPEAVRNMTFYAGRFPASYGGRLSSVIDISLKDGREEGVKAAASLGVISADVLVSGSSKAIGYVAGFRKSLLAQTVSRVQIDRSAVIPTVDFEEGILKLSVKAAPNFTLSLLTLQSGNKWAQKTRAVYSDTMSGGQRVTLNTTENSSIWSDQLYSFRASYWASPNLNWEFLVYRVHSNMANEQEVASSDGPSLSNQTNRQFAMSKLSTDIRDTGVRTQVKMNISAEVQAEAGGAVIQHDFTVLPLQFLNQRQNSNPWAVAQPVEVRESSVFGSLKYAGSGGFATQAGVRAVRYDARNQTIRRIEPRIGVSQKLSPFITAGYSLDGTTQYLNQLSNSGVGAPVDLWIPYLENRVGFSSQHALGLQFRREKLEAEVTLFTKSMKNLHEFEEGANFLATGAPWQQQIVIGSGRSRGVEFVLFKGWRRSSIQLTYAGSDFDRTFEKLNNGQPFPSKFNRAHYFNGIYSLSTRKNWTWSVSSSVMSGYNVTKPLAVIPNQPLTPIQWELFDNSVVIFGSRNGFRLPTYARLDVQGRRSFDWGRLDGEVALGFFNLLNRNNVSHLSVNTWNELEYVFLFPIIPFVTLKVEG